MNTSIVWLNVGLAFIASAVAFGALNKMNVRTTRPCVVVAYLLLMIGMASQWLGELSSQWDHLADTATFGGVLALLLASQREASWQLERWAKPLASIVGVVALVAFVVQLVWGPL